MQHLKVRGSSFDQANVIDRDGSKHDRRILRSFDRPAPPMPAGATAANLAAASAAQDDTTRLSGFAVQRICMLN
jgi:hypothetical protein